MNQQETIKDLLATSATLFNHLNLSAVPDGEERDAYIERIDELLDARGILLKQLPPNALKNHQLLPHLQELDEGIRARLAKTMEVVKTDIANLKKSKKSEQQYTNQYSSLRMQDGMYYDSKK